MGLTNRVIWVRLDVRYSASLVGTSGIGHPEPMTFTHNETGKAKGQWGRDIIWSTTTRIAMTWHRMDRLHWIPQCKKLLYIFID